MHQLHTESLKIMKEQLIDGMLLHTITGSYPELI